MSVDVSTRTLEVPGAVLTYDVRTPASGSARPPLFVLGSPMGASGFAQLVSHLEDRVVLTYDPRMAERSRLTEGGEVSIARHAEDLHAVVADSGLGPVDVFGSSGGAMVALPWAVDHPEDLRTLVAHEPPLTLLLEDAEIAQQAMDDIAETYRREGFGPAMAKFIQLIMTPGPLPEDYRERPAPDPAQFGLPTADDGSRDDPLLAHNVPMTPYRPDASRLLASGVRIVPAIGEQGEGTLARRGGEALADLLGVEPVVFPGDHGGFAASDWTPHNDPATFAARLREVLDGPA
ncbi:alpha/beta fold hydrolase [Brachybacterium phenoliresistens]|uniref:Hydrolase n=1 Tax=Brachybacterium phenoliresistens TaxID=396014 RepID=Z9JRC8_9MICO|nr:alpha/beta hydrolase [Brachybacterium phenoliresistens]EWS80543.1 hydrolase [Brachybacterium phenoliresistens]